MNAFPAKKSIPAVLATLAFLAFWHLVIAEPGRPWWKVAVPLLVLLVGELVREWVVARTPASEDESVIEHRRWWARLAAVGFVAAAGTFVVLAYYNLVDRKTPVGYVLMLALLLALVTCGAFAMGLTLNDKARQAAKVPAEVQAVTGSTVKVVLFFVSLGMISVVGMSEYADWETSRHLSMLARIKLVAILVVTVGFNVMVWRQIAQSVRTAEDASHG